MKYPNMDDGSRLSWVIAIVLLFCAMFCAVTETAFSASSRPRLRALSETGNKKATKALAVLDDFDRAISTILICTNIVHLSIASIVTVAVTKSMGLNAVAVSTIITTMVVFFAGEMLPKSIAKKYAEPLAMFCAAPLMFFMTLLTPLSAALSAIGNFASGFIKGEPEISVTEEELYDIIEDMTEEGMLEEEQGDLISSAIRYGARRVEDILTERKNIVAIDVDAPLESVLSTVNSCNHSRIPVFDGDIDHVVGILQIRTFIKAYLKDREKLKLRDTLEKPFFVEQSSDVDSLLPRMSKNRQNLAIVTDLAGVTVGLVTIEDMVEEIVGEIYDEDDVVAKAGRAKI